jgi:hypothetical protein
MGVVSLGDIPTSWFANDYDDSAWDAPEIAVNMELSLAGKRNAPTIWSSGVDTACSLFRVRITGSYPYHYKGILCPDGSERYSYDLLLDSKLQGEGPVEGLAVYGGRQVPIFGEMKLTPPESGLHESSTLAPTTEGIFSYIESDDSRQVVGQEQAPVDHTRCEIYDELQVGCQGAVMVGAYGDQNTSGTLTLELDYSELPPEFDEGADLDSSFSHFEHIVEELKEHDGVSSKVAADVDALVKVEVGMKREVQRLRRVKDQFQQQSVSLMEKVIELQHQINTAHSHSNSTSSAPRHGGNPAVWHATFLDGEMGIVVGRGASEDSEWGGDQEEELQIMSVVQGTQADRQGIRQGAVVTGVNGIPLAQMLDDPFDTDEFVERLGELPRPLTLDILKTKEHPPPDGYGESVGGSAVSSAAANEPAASSMALADAINTQVKIALAAKEEETNSAVDAARREVQTEIDGLRRRLAAAKDEGRGGTSEEVVARIKLRHEEEMREALQRQEEEYQRALSNALKSKQNDNIRRIEEAYTQALETAMDQKDADYTQKLGAVLRAAEADTQQQLAAQQATFSRVQKLALVQELGDGHGAMEALRRANDDELRAEMNAQLAAETLKIAKQHAKEMERALSAQEEKHSQHLAEVVSALRVQHEDVLRGAIDSRDRDAAAAGASVKAGHDAAWRRLISQVLTNSLLSPAAAAILQSDLQMVAPEGTGSGNTHVEIADAVLRALQESHQTNVGGTSAVKAVVAEREAEMVKKMQTLEQELREERRKQRSPQTHDLNGDATNINQVYSTVEKAYADEMVSGCARLNSNTVCWLLALAVVLCWLLALAVLLCWCPL